MAGITGKDAVLTGYAVQLQALDAPKGRSLTQDAIRRLTRNKAAVVSIFVVIAIVLFAFRRAVLPALELREDRLGRDPQAARISRRATFSAPTRMAATCWPAPCRARRCR